MVMDMRSSCVSGSHHHLTSSLLLLVVHPQCVTVLSTLEHTAMLHVHQPPPAHVILPNVLIHHTHFKLTIASGVGWDFDTEGLVPNYSIFLVLLLSLAFFDGGFVFGGLAVDGGFDKDIVFHFAEGV